MINLQLTRQKQNKLNQPLYITRPNGLPLSLLITKRKSQIYNGQCQTSIHEPSNPDSDNDRKQREAKPCRPQFYALYPFLFTGAEVLRGENLAHAGSPFCSWQRLPSQPVPNLSELFPGHVLDCTANCTANILLLIHLSAWGQGTPPSL